MNRIRLQMYPRTQQNIMILFLKDQEKEGTKELFTLCLISSL